jgi:hypothetical protein
MDVGPSTSVEPKLAVWVAPTGPRHAGQPSPCHVLFESSQLTLSTMPYHQPSTWALA